MLLQKTQSVTCEGDFLCNNYEQYFWLVGVFLFVILFNRFISKLIAKLLFAIIKKTKAKGSAELFFRLILKPVQYLIVLETLFIGIHSLHAPPFFTQPYIGITIQQFIFSVYRILLILNVAWFASRLSDFFIFIFKKKAEETTDPWDDQLIIFLKDVFKVFIWFIAIFCLLAVVFHVNIASLVAGAGIAGIALAFAAQETLQNIFGSIAIFSEKPFVVGDLIDVDGVTGTVVKVGFRSTRILTLDTSYMTIPNKTIVNNKLSNLKKRASRRIQFLLGLTYQTEKATLEKIIFEIKQYGENHPKKNDEINVGLYQFGAYAIEIWVEFYLQYELWDAYILTRNDVMFSILEIVKKNNAIIAYPTQVLKVDSFINTFPQQSIS